MSTIVDAQPYQWKTRLRRIVALVLLLLSTILVVRAWANRTILQNQTSTSDQSQRESNQPEPGNVLYQTSASASVSSEAWINFDTFQNGSIVPSGTIITSQYAPAIFSTDSSHYCVALSGQNYGSSLPNRLTRGPSSPSNYGYAPLYVDFTQPVNNLRFYILAADDYRAGIAKINVFQNNSLTSSLAWMVIEIRITQSL